MRASVCVRVVVCAIVRGGMRLGTAHARVGDYDETLPVGFAIDWIHRARLAGLRLEVLDDVVLLRRIRGGSLSGPGAERDRGYLEMARRAIARTRGT